MTRVQKRLSAEETGQPDSGNMTGCEDISVPPSGRSRASKRKRCESPGSDNEDTEEQGLVSPNAQDSGVTKSTKWKIWTNGLPNNGVGSDLEKRSGPVTADRYAHWYLYNVITIPMVAGKTLINQPLPNTLLSDELAGYLFSLRCQNQISAKFLKTNWPGDFTKDGFLMVNREPRGRPFKCLDKDGVVRYGVAHYMRLSGDEIKQSPLIEGVNRGCNLKNVELNNPVTWIDDSIVASSGEVFTLLDLSPDRCAYLDDLEMPQEWLDQIPLSAPRTKDRPNNIVRATPISREDVLQQYPNFFNDQRDDSEGQAKESDTESKKKQRKTAVPKADPVVRSSLMSPDQSQSDSPTPQDIPAQYPPITYAKPASLKPSESPAPVPSRFERPSINDIANKTRKRTSLLPEQMSQTMPLVPSFVARQKAAKYPINWSGFNIEQSTLPDHIDQISEQEITLMRGAELAPSALNSAFLHTISAQQAVINAKDQYIGTSQAFYGSAHKTMIEQMAALMGHFGLGLEMCRGFGTGVKLLSNSGEVMKQENQDVIPATAKRLRISPKEHRVAMPQVSDALRENMDAFVEGAFEETRAAAQEEFHNQEAGLHEYLDVDLMPAAFRNMGVRNRHE